MDVFGDNDNHEHTRQPKIAILLGEGSNDVVCIMILHL